MSDKTEAPTPRRRKRARDEGDSGASAFAAQSLAFCAAVALAPSAVKALAARAAGDFRETLARVAVHGRAAQEVDPTALAQGALALTLPLLAGVAAVAAVATLVQTGGGMATGRIAPDFSRLNPIGGLGKLFSGARLFAVARALLGATLIATMAGGLLLRHAGDLAHGSGRLAWVPVVVSTLGLGVAFRAAALGLVLGALDALVTRTAWTRRLRMTSSEVKREVRESEGDPQIKAARERAHHEMLAQATLGQVRTASVVVVNPTHLASALRYDERAGDEAPTVVANGEGEFAARIVEIARQYGVPVLRDVPLARALAELHVGETIPEALYEAVAAVLREVDA